MLNRIRLWLRTVFQRRRLDREMQDEMDLHLTQSTHRLMSRGLTESEARRAARREFGNVDYLQEEARDARGARWVESVLADFRFGLRYFARMPLSALTMVALLALGIGFNSALFTFAYSFVLMPPRGIDRLESLVRIRGLDRSAGATRTIGREFSYPEYRDYAGQTNLFSAVTAWTSSDVVLAAGNDPESLRSGATTYVTSNYFQVLGVRPVKGAGLPVTAPDNGAPQLVAVISQLVWDRHFGMAPDVIGRALNVNDVTVTVVGVAPRGFAGARTGGSQMRVWLPLNTRPLVQHSTASALSSYDSAFFSLAARLRPGVTPSQAQSTVAGIAARSAQQSVSVRGSAMSTDVVTLTGENYYPPSGEAPNVVSRASSLMIPLLILLIPCTNVSALLVGLAVRRRREIAVRLSLGANRKRIVRQLITESVLLALAAGALGLCVIAILLKLFGTRVPNLQLVLHWPVFAFTFGIAALTGILFGVSPALHATRVSVAEVMKDAANAVASARSRLQSGLVVTQIAMTQPLLLGLAALLLNLLGDLQRLPAVSFGDRIVQVSFATNRRNATEQQREDMLLRLQARFAALPGVQAVVLQADQDDFVRVAVHPADRVASLEYQESFHVRTKAAPPGYFELMGYPFVRGGGFDRDSQNDDRALVIRGDLARRLWGSADPIGKRLVQAGGGATAFVVVGVVDETKAGLSGNDPRVFVPNLSRTGSILVRTRGPADPMIPALRSVANAEAPLVPITSATTLASIDARERSVFRRASGAALGGGLVALFLSAIGLYAIVSFAVNQRMREIGIRTALGAEPQQVVRMFFFNGLRLSFIGLLIGLGLSAVVVRIQTLANGGESGGGIFLTAAAVAVVVVAVASLATWIPARRAARVDPLSMLRTE